MSSHCIILEFQPTQVQKARHSNLTKFIKKILVKRCLLSVKTIKPLPYCNTKMKRRFRVPSDYPPSEESGKFYFYYMASDRNPKLKVVQDKLEGSSCTFLKALENTPFLLVEGETQVEEEEPSNVLASSISLLSPTQELEKINQDLRKKLFIATKKLEVYETHSNFHMSHRANKTSVINADEPFLFSKGKIAFKCSRCQHSIQSSEYAQMKEAQDGAAFCPLCRHEGRCNFTEEWD